MNQDPRRSSNNASGSQPWASGRVLTAQQRERKRLIDRTARRSQKQRFQERINELEARVQELESTSPDKLDIADGNGGVERSDSTSWSSGVDSQPLTPNSMINVDSVFSLYGNLHSEGRSDRLATPDVVQDSSATSVAALNALCSDISGVILLPPRMRLDGREITQTLNSLVYYVRNLPTEAVCFEDGCNQDFLIRYVLEGWQSSVSRYEQTCPLWHVLRIVDLVLFNKSPTIERAAMLRMLHRMYLFEISSRSGAREPLPIWYKPQASQQTIKHDPVVDHLAWPRLRQRLIVHEHNTLSNRFWLLFARNFRFVWSHEVFDALHFNRPGGQYGFSGILETALHCIGNWRMELEFLEAFPDLAGDIVPTVYAPLNRQPSMAQLQYPHLIAPRFGRQGQLTLGVQHVQLNQAQQQRAEQQQVQIIGAPAGSQLGFQGAPTENLLNSTQPLVSTPQYFFGGPT